MRRESLKNGFVLGATAGALTLWGRHVINLLTKILPNSLQTFAGSLSVPIVIIGLGGVIGLIVDKV